MALLAVTSWTANKVQDWLSGLDDSVQNHIDKFVQHNVTGRKLLLLSAYDLQTMIDTIGQQEVILDAIQHLANVFYGTESETIVSLAFELRCQSKSLVNQLRAVITKRSEPRNVAGQQLVEPVAAETQIGAQTLLLVQTARTLLDWFGEVLPANYSELDSFRQKLLLETVSLTEGAHACLRRSGAPSSLLISLRESATRIESLCDLYVKNCRDAVAITPCLLEIVTMKLKPADELGIHLHTSAIGAHVIASIAPGSAAAQCGKLCEYDELIQVNSITVIGWQHRKVIQLLERESESGRSDMLFMIRRRPFALPEYGRVRHAHAQQCAAGAKVSSNAAAASATTTLTRVSSRAKKQSIRKNDSASTYLPDSGNGSPCIECERCEDPRADVHDLSEGSLRLGEHCDALDSASERERLKQAAIQQLGGLASQDSVRYRDRRNTVSILRRSTANCMTANQAEPRNERESSQKTDSDDAKTSVAQSAAKLSDESSSVSASNLQSTSNAAPGLNVPITATVHHQRHHSADVLLDVRSDSEQQTPRPRVSDDSSPYPSPFPSPTSPCSSTAQPAIYGTTAPRTTAKRSNPSAQPARSDTASRSSASSTVATHRERTTTTTSVAKGQSLTGNNKDTIAITAISQNVFSFSKPKETSGAQTAQTQQAAKQQRPRAELLTSTNSDSSAVESCTPSPSSGVSSSATPSRRIDRRVSCKDLGKGDLEGWLWRKRKPGRLPKAGWVKRWFVLKHSCLYYYKTRDDQRAEGVLQMHAAIVSPDDTRADKRAGAARHRFTIQNPHIVFHLAAETEPERLDWLKRLQLTSIGVDPRSATVSQHTHSSAPSTNQLAAVCSSFQVGSTASSVSTSTSSSETPNALATQQNSANGPALAVSPAGPIEDYFTASSDDDDDVVLFEHRESFIENSYHPSECKQCK